MSRVDVFRMIRRRAKDAAISTAVCCHTFRATGITAYLENGGTLEHAQQIAAHERLPAKGAGTARSQMLHTTHTCSTTSLSWTPPFETWMSGLIES